MIQNIISWSTKLYSHGDLDYGLADYTDKKFVSINQIYQQQNFTYCAMLIITPNYFSNMSILSIHCGKKSMNLNFIERTDTFALY